ncbi:MAG: hypothetical protein ACOCWH_05780 [Spirochaetota bacterium]
MNISCNNCGKVHDVPDDAVSNKKVYFFCSSCRHKIIVDSRTKISEHLSDIHPLTGFTDIFSGLFSFFSWTGILVSSLHMILSILIIGVCAQFVYLNMAFFLSHPGAAVFFGVFLLLILVFTRSLVLYYMSKIMDYRFHHPESTSVSWKSVHFDFQEDWITVLVYSCACAALLGILVVPLPYLGSFGIFYSGIFYPVIFVLVLFIILLSVLFRFLPSILATGSFFVRDGLREILAFIAREYVEMPFYWIIITVTAKFFSFLFFGLYAAAVFASSMVIFLFMPGEAKDSVLHFLSSLPMMRSAREAVPAYVGLGSVMLGMMILLSLVLFLSFMDNLIQSLYVKAVLIMKQNPRESFNRYAMIGIMGFLIIATLLGVLIISTVLSVPLSVTFQKILGV